MNLREIATKKNAGFRTKNITVPEWGGISLVIREPSVGAWGEWSKLIKEISEIDNDENKTTKQVEAEAILFASVLCDENGDVVFSGDLTDLINNYGPIHSRILNKALELSGIGNNPIEDAEKK